MDFLNKKEAALNNQPHRLLTKSIEKFTLYAFLPLAFSILVNHLLRISTYSPSKFAL